MAALRAVQSVHSTNEAARNLHQATLETVFRDVLSPNVRPARSAVAAIHHNSYNMGALLPPPAAKHTGRVLFNPTAPWGASEVDLVIGSNPFGRYGQPCALESICWDDSILPPDLLPSRPPTPAWVPAEELLLPPGWQEVRAGEEELVVMYDATKFEGTPVSFPSLGVKESGTCCSTGWHSEGEYTAVLLTSKLEPSLHLLALAATGLHQSSNIRRWWDPAVNLLDLLEKASHLNGIPALCGSQCQGSLAGSGYLAETTPAGAEEAPAAGQTGGGVGEGSNQRAAGGSRGQVAGWLTGVLLPPDEMAWRPPPLLRPLRENEWCLARSHPHVFGIGPFHPAHFVFSTPRSALHLSNVHRSQEGQLAADYTLTHP